MSVVEKTLFAACHEDPALNAWIGGLLLALMRVSKTGPWPHMSTADLLREAVENDSDVVLFYGSPSFFPWASSNYNRYLEQGLAGYHVPRVFRVLIRDGFRSALYPGFGGDGEDVVLAEAAVLQERLATLWVQRMPVVVFAPINLSAPTRWYHSMFDLVLESHRPIRKAVINITGLATVICAQYTERESKVVDAYRVSGIVSLFFCGKTSAVVIDYTKDNERVRKSMCTFFFCGITVYVKLALGSGVTLVSYEYMWK